MCPGAAETSSSPEVVAVQQQRGWVLCGCWQLPVFSWAAVLTTKYKLCSAQVCVSCLQHLLAHANSDPIGRLISLWDSWAKHHKPNQVQTRLFPQRRQTQQSSGSESCSMSLGTAAGELHGGKVLQRKQKKHLQFQESTKVRTY